MVAKARYAEEHRPLDFAYSGKSKQPEDDVNFILGWFARSLLQPSAGSDKSTNEELRKIFPDERELPEFEE